MADDNNLNLQELPDEAAAAAEPTATPAPEPDPGLAQPDDGGSETEIVRTARNLEAVFDIPVQVSAVLGKATMQVNQLLKLGRGAVVELDRKVGEAVDIYVNNRLVARGEVVIVDERLGVTMTEIIKGDSK
jgi:flagellar motor switch protein FliN/FliY